jgi:hypothetical protein
VVVKVESYAGFKADEKPVRFQLGETWLAVLDVADRWYEPDAVYFKVLAEDGHTYILRRSDAEEEWNLTAFRRAC